MKREFTKEALDSLIEDTNTNLQALRTELNEKELTLTKLKLRTKVFGQEDLDPTEEILIRVLPEEIMRLEDEVARCEVRLQQLEDYRDRVYGYV